MKYGCASLLPLRTVCFGGMLFRVVSRQLLRCVVVVYLTKREVSQTEVI